MNILAIIPARAGSCGIPDKNVRVVAGKPLLAWSIEAAKASSVDRIFVSTDSPRYAEIAERAGAEAIMRPPELATAEAMTDPVLVHVVDALARNGYAPHLVVTLQPTVPIRPHGLIDACIALLLEKDVDSVLTGRRLHFVWWREAGYEYTGSPGTGSETMPYWRSQCERRPRRQDMRARELMFEEDGSVYVTRADFLLRHGKRISPSVELVETSRTVDVDTEEDLLIADAILRARMTEEVVA